MEMVGSSSTGNTRLAFLNHAGSIARSMTKLPPALVTLREAFLSGSATVPATIAPSVALGTARVKTGSSCGGGEKFHEPPEAPPPLGAVPAGGGGGGDQVGCRATVVSGHPPLVDLLRPAIMMVVT